MPSDRFRGPCRRFAERVTLATGWLALLAALPTVQAHPGHDDGTHVEPIYSLVLVAGLCLLGGSFLLLTREDADGSRWGTVFALVGVAMIAIGASAWL